MHVLLFCDHTGRFLLYDYRSQDYKRYGFDPCLQAHYMKFKNKTGRRAGDPEKL
jgi:hypothetical protein